MNFTNCYQNEPLTAGRPLRILSRDFAETDVDADWVRGILLGPGTTATDFSTLSGDSRSGREKSSSSSSPSSISPVLISLAFEEVAKVGGSEFCLDPEESVEVFEVPSPRSTTAEETGGSTMAAGTGGSTPASETEIWRKTKTFKIQWLLFPNPHNCQVQSQVDHELVQQVVSSQNLRTASRFNTKYTMNLFSMMWPLKTWGSLPGPQPGSTPSRPWTCSAWSGLSKLEDRGQDQPQVDHELVQHVVASQNLRTAARFTPNPTQFEK